MALTKVTYSMIEGAVINALDYGADNTGATDSSAAIQSAVDAIASTPTTIYFPAGTYKINTGITTTGNLIISGDGDATIFDFTGTVTGSYAFDVTGSLTAISDLSASCLAGDTSLTFASAPALSENDVFVIFNPTDYSWSGFRSYYKAGEWCEVDSISSTTVTLKNSLYDGYTYTAVDVYKLNSPIVSLKNFKIVGDTSTGLINISLARNALLENISGNHKNNSVIQLDRCFAPAVYNPRINNIGDGGDDYGVAIGNSQHAKVDGGLVYSRRHAITVGGNNETGCVPNRDVRIFNATLKNDIASGVWSADFHGNTEDSSYENCTIFNGATFQGRNISYVNCSITNMSFGSCVYSAEIKGGDFYLTNCRLRSTINPQPNTRGVIDIGGNSSPVTANTTLYTTFGVKNCVFYGRGMSNLTSFVLFKNNGCVTNVNFNIDGVELNVDNIGIVLTTQNVSGTAASQYIVVDNLLTAAFSGVYLHNSVGNAYTNFPHKLQRQSGISTLTTSTTVDNVSEAVTYKWVYPKVPALTVGVTKQTFIGGVTPVATADPATITGHTNVYSTPDATNFSSVVSGINICWTAGIDET